LNVSLHSTLSGTNSEWMLSRTLSFSLALSASALSGGGVSVSVPNSAGWPGGSVDGSE
jgi:hypothetical protein